jgi:hypothetical protein
VISLSEPLYWDFTSITTLELSTIPFFFSISVEDYQYFWRLKFARRADCENRRRPKQKDKREERRESDQRPRFNTVFDKVTAVSYHERRKLSAIMYTYAHSLTRPMAKEMSVVIDPAIRTTQKKLIWLPMRSASYAYSHIGK